MRVNVYFRSGQSITFHDITEIREVFSATAYFHNYHIVLQGKNAMIATFYMANIAGYSKRGEEETEEARSKP